MTELDIQKPCTYCGGVSDFVMIDGAWYVCTGCIKEGKTDTEAQILCVICGDPATHKKMGRDICEYHYDLSNDHKRGRD